jgi:hypothetical protein
VHEPNKFNFFKTNPKRHLDIGNVGFYQYAKFHHLKYLIFKGVQNYKNLTYIQCKLLKYQNMSDFIIFVEPLHLDLLT